MISTANVPAPVRSDRRKFYVWIVLGISALVFLPGLSAYGILDPSDGLYAECAREMIELRDYLTPHFNYVPFLEKPIFLFWSIIACYKLFGVHEWAARLPSALAGILCTLSVFAFTRNYIGARTAAGAAIILCSMPMFSVIGHLALIDMMVALFMTTAFLGFFDRLQGGSKLVLWSAYASLGLLVLAKGPVPAGFVVIPAFLYLLCLGAQPDEPWYRVWWRRAWQLHPAAGAAIIAVITLPWFLTENAATHGAFFQEFFIKQNLGRAAGAASHQESWSFYLPFVFGGMLPWWLVLFSALPALPMIWRKRKTASSAQKLALMCVVWLAFVLIGCSALKTKLIPYILPAWPPVAILCSMTLTILLRRGARRTMLVFCVCVVFGMIAVLVAPAVASSFGHATVVAKLLFIAGVILLFAAMSFCAMSCLRQRSRVGVQSAVILCALATAILTPTALNQYYRERHRAFRETLADCERIGGPVALFMRDAPSANFYLRRPVPVLVNAPEIEQFAKNGKGRHLLVVRDDLLALAAQRAPKLTLLSEHGRFSLFDIEP